MTLFSTSRLNMLKSETPALGTSVGEGVGINEPLRMTAFSFPSFLPSSPLALHCQDLPAPKGAQVNCFGPFGASRYQSTCSFACGAGLVLVGADELRCLAAGNWSAAAPECQGEVARGWCFMGCDLRGGNHRAARNLKLTGKLISTFLL